jgi:alpha-beta hydrolase superfamily lysophospholipase
VTVDVSAIIDRMAHWPNGMLERIANAKHERFQEIPDVRNDVVARILEFFSEDNVQNFSHI